jgi:ribosomal protein S24E
VKQLIFSILFVTVLFSAFGQQPSFSKKEPTKKDVKKKKINELIKHAEEGVLVYNKQSVFGVQGKTLGYGLFYELGKMKTNRKTATYRIDLTEIKSLKQDKFQSASTSFLFYGSPFIYGKVNNFYQLSMSYGQQKILGQKGNKNGVAVSALYQGGLSLGCLKPYYLQVQDAVTNTPRYIKYSKADSSLFLGNRIMGAGGIGRGWNELTFKPGFIARTALRFDYGRYNEVVSGLEIGLTAEYFTDKITIMAAQDKDKSMFFQAYIAMLFGRRK